MTGLNLNMLSLTFKMYFPPDVYTYSVISTIDRTLLGIGFKGLSVLSLHFYEFLQMLQNQTVERT